jgi:FHS family L-fucose permease-like MFS transporter
MVGRFVGSALLQKLKTGPVLGTAALIASALVLISILTTGKVAMWSIILVGLFNSVMFPSIFTLAIEGLGRLTGRGSSLLVMAIVGGAVIPEVQAILADRLVGLHAAFLVPAICYLYIVFYGFSGSKQPARAAV